MRREYRRLIYSNELFTNILIELTACIAGNMGSKVISVQQSNLLEAVSAIQKHFPASSKLITILSLTTEDCKNVCQNSLEEGAEALFRMLFLGEASWQSQGTKHFSMVAPLLCNTGLKICLFCLLFALSVL